MTTLTETVGEGELSFTLKWQLGLIGPLFAFVEVSRGAQPYAKASIFQDGCVAVGAADNLPFVFRSSEGIKLHLALLKWIYIRGRELTKNPNMEAW